MKAFVLCDKASQAPRESGYTPNQKFISNLLPHLSSKGKLFPIKRHQHLNPGDLDILGNLQIFGKKRTTKKKEAVGKPMSSSTDFFV